MKLAGVTVLCVVVLTACGAAMASCNGSGGQAQPDAAAPLDASTGTDATARGRDSGGQEDATPPPDGMPPDGATASDGSVESGCEAGQSCPDAGTGCPAAPPEAVQAGFATCAADFDFSQPSYETTANWLDCSGTSGSSLPWHAGAPGLIPQSSGGPPCTGNVAVANDPAAGKNVLQLTWLQSFATTYACASKGIACSVSIMTAMNGTNGINNSGPLTASFPVGLYVETMSRISTTYSSTPSFLDDSSVWLWQAPSSGTFGSTQAAIEDDVVELTASGGGSGIDGIHNWGDNDYSYPTWTSYAPGNTHVPPGWSPTAYHKYGYLITSDGATHVYSCEWIDGVFQSCGDAHAQSYQYTDRNFLVTTIQGGGLDNAYAQSDVTSYVEYIRVWSCPGWATGQCNASTLVSGPPPALTYWK